MPSVVMVPKIGGTTIARGNRKSSSESLNEDYSATMMDSSPFVISEEGEFSSTATTLEDDDFDPFHIGDSAINVADTPNSPSKMAFQPTPNKNITFLNEELDKNINRETKNTVSNSGTSVKSSISAGLIPPKMLVKFKVHEEVSSVASLTEDNEGTSEVFIEGTVMAQVVSSDALKNAPFALLPSSDNKKQKIQFLPNDMYTKPYMTKGEKGNPPSKVNVVKIPKDILGFVPVGSYKISSSVEHMPLLLEQKVVRSKSKIQIALQIRSKLTNPDDLSDFSIVISIPPRVNANSVAVLSGEGKWDRWKRCVTWELGHLPKGQSVMDSVKCALDDTDENPEQAQSNDGLNFPVMMRCKSNDLISTTRFSASEASGYPATVSSSMVGRSFRIVHRLK